MLKEIKLAVKWFSQLDSRTMEAGRMCNSSSNAMVANFFKPGVVKGPYDQMDDNWLEGYVHKYGDSTSHEAQTAALKDVGIQSVFHKDWSIEKVIDQLEKGKPVVCGVLHKGPITAPYGDGHMVVAVGVTADRKYLYVHDPAGELDLVNGGYHITDNGQYRKYSVENFRRRFELTMAGEYTRGRNGWAREIVSVAA